MPHTNAFQPKNARIVNTFDDDDDLDDASLFGSSITSSTKKTSGTQALADFLNTTSPEEFQRPSPASTAAQEQASCTIDFLYSIYTGPDTHDYHIHSGRYAICGPKTKAAAAAAAG
ncbi:hypothetical protein BDB00DRAFT_793504 [Zychaea mexicana]|uniref:uncharacterized protein n=1 Tax=Zychaea mexicana TaxID=64656 RepID=UPI0022FDD7A0|nr:uncharacterized protein BDB00DRAFT_793504 [Zychaea mexicana]KAI9472929.1 hypothetical protein BDB00DRAFT_793504 [Zychaea mexicana]